MPRARADGGNHQELQRTDSARAERLYPEDDVEGTLAAADAAKENDTTARS